MIEFDNKKFKNYDGSFNVHTSRSEYEIPIRDISQYRSYMLIGSHLTVRYNQGRGSGRNPGICMIIKPIIGEPPLLPKVSQLATVNKELEQLLISKRSPHSNDNPGT